MYKIFVLFCLTTSLCMIDTARILGVFPTPSVSHQVVFRVLMKELVKRGHEVVVITTDPAYAEGQAPTNLTEIDVHDVSYKHYSDVMPEILKELDYGKKISLVTFERQLQRLSNVIEVQINSEPIQKLIKEKRQFDVLLIEPFLRPAIAYSHIYKAPVILVSSFGASLENLEAFGASTHPILYPILYRQRIYNLSFYEKLKEYYSYAQYMYLQKSYERYDNELVQRIFGPNVPSVAELNQNAQMLFLNYHPIWMGNQPVPPGIIFMGGLHQKPVKELPQDLQSYLDSSQNGVIYVSFGTNVHPYGFPTDKLKIITEALSELPYDILFKWTADELPGRSKNIRISKWLPQSDLLRHPKIKAFLMQGGLQSTDEAITAGVPLVCIPMIGDQWFNAEKYVHLNIGLQLDLPTLTKTELKESLETVISNTSYRENIIKLRERMNDQPQSPLDRAVWWVEYVLRHGGAQHLRTPAANMSWIEYYELQLVSVVLIILVIVIIISLFIIMSIWRYIRQFIYSVKVKKC